MPLTLKRLREIVVAGLAIILLSPLMALIAVVIRLDTGGPVLSGESHLGLNSEVFRRYKYRTKYSTPVGSFLRQTKLDKLPQLINVLRGEMSFFGPAPLSFSEAMHAGANRLEAATSQRPGLFHTRPTTWGAAMIDVQKMLRLVGESVRDIGILIAVFAPLDAYFSYLQQHPTRLLYVVLIVIGALLFVVVGIILESRK